MYWYGLFLKLEGGKEWKMGLGKAKSPRAASNLQREKVGKRGEKEARE